MAKSSSTKSPQPAAQRQRGPFLGSNRLDRILGSMFFGMLLLSVVAILLLFVGAMTGLFRTTTAAFHASVAMTPLITLPLAVVLFVVLIVRLAIRRRKETTPS